MCLLLPWRRKKKTFKLAVSSRRICGYKLFKQPPPVCQTVCRSFKDKLVLEYKTLLSVNGISRNADRSSQSRIEEKLKAPWILNKQHPDKSTAVRTVCACPATSLHQAWHTNMWAVSARVWRCVSSNHYISNNIHIYSATREYFLGKKGHFDSSSRLLRPVWGWKCGFR